MSSPSVTFSIADEMPPSSSSATNIPSNTTPTKNKQNESYVQKIVNAKCDTDLPFPWWTFFYFHCTMKLSIFVFQGNYASSSPALIRYRFSAKATYTTLVGWPSNRHHGGKAYMFSLFKRNATWKVFCDCYCCCGSY